MRCLRVGQGQDTSTIFSGIKLTCPSLGVGSKIFLIFLFSNFNLIKFYFQDIENYLRNNSSDDRIDKIQEIGKDLVDLGFLKEDISNEITEILIRRDQLHHQVRFFKFDFLL